MAARNVVDMPEEFGRAPSVEQHERALLVLFYRALSDRLLVWAAGAGAAGAFAWALWHAGPWTLGAAVAFTVLVYLPTLKLKGG